MLPFRYLTTSALLHVGVIGIIYGWVKVHPTEPHTEAVEIEWVGEECGVMSEECGVKSEEIEPTPVQPPIPQQPSKLAPMKIPKTPQSLPQPSPQPSPQPKRPLSPPVQTPAKIPQSLPQLPPTPQSPPSLSPIATVQPKYPRKARIRGIEGQVKVRLQVSSAGEVGRVEVIEGSGSTMLDEAALEAAKTTRFKPNAQSNLYGEAILTFDFRLK